MLVHLKRKTGAAAGAKLVFCAEQSAASTVSSCTGETSLSAAWRPTKLSFLHQGDWYLIKTLLSCSSRATSRQEMARNGKYNCAHLEAPKMMQRKNYFRVIRLIIYCKFITRIVSGLKDEFVKYVNFSQISSAPVDSSFGQFQHLQV